MVERDEFLRAIGLSGPQQGFLFQEGFSTFRMAMPEIHTTCVEAATACLKDGNILAMLVGVCDNCRPVLTAAFNLKQANNINHGGGAYEPCPN